MGNITAFCQHLPRPISFWPIPIYRWNPNISPIYQSISNCLSLLWRLVTCSQRVKKLLFYTMKGRFKHHKQSSQIRWPRLFIHVKNRTESRTMDNVLEFWISKNSCKSSKRRFSLRWNRSLSFSFWKFSVIQDGKLQKLDMDLHQS